MSEIMLWTPEALERLIKLWLANYSVERIAEIFNCPKRAIETQIYKRKLPFRPRWQYRPMFDPALEIWPPVEQELSLPTSGKRLPTANPPPPWGYGKDKPTTPKPSKPVVGLPQPKSKLSGPHRVVKATTSLSRRETRVWSDAENQADIEAWLAKNQVTKCPPAFVKPADPNAPKRSFEEYKKEQHRIFGKRKRWDAFRNRELAKRAS